MNCSACSGCNCNGTVRSRRCSCQQTPRTCDRPQPLTRNTVNCEDNSLFIDYGPTPGEYESPYLMTTEAYGSGLSTVGLRQLRVFEENIHRFKNGYSYRPHATSDSRGIAPMTKLEAANAIRYGRDITIQ